MKLCRHAWSGGSHPEHVFNGCAVHYTDAAGQEQTELVKCDSPTNPANAHDIQRWGLIRLESHSTAVAAATIGRAWLTKQAALSRPSYRCERCGHMHHGSLRHLLGRGGSHQ